MISAREPALALARHGEVILRTVGVEPTRTVEVLAERVAPSEPSPFRGRLRDGLEALLRGVAARDPRVATAAACRLVGVGPGSTPLGDDYIAACGLTMLRVGRYAGLTAAETETFVDALCPQRLATLTTPESSRMIAGALAGEIPEPVQGMYRLEVEAGELTELVGGLVRIGASSGRAWAAVIGATAMLVGSPDGAP